MAGDLDPVSAALGRLEAQMADAQRSREMLRQDVRTTADEMRGAARQLVELEAKLEAVTGRLDQAWPHVESWRTTRQRAIGFMLGYGAVAGAGGAWIVDAVRALFNR